MFEPIIKDDLLDISEHDVIQSTLLSNEFPWFYRPNQVEGTKDGSFFAHQFFWGIKGYVETTELIMPIIHKLMPINAFVSIRANMLINKGRPNVSDWHQDFGHLDSNEIKTAIYYVNTNNGYTELRDYGKVESKANRLVTFPNKMDHRAVAQTDEEARVVINFNYY